jgi:hypothetical protein
MPAPRRTRAALMLLSLAALPPQVAAAAPLATSVATEAPALPASAEALALAAWVVAKGDAHGLPFVVIDKVHAQVVAFAADGVVRATTPALLGAARGDVSPPGIGTLKLSQISPDMRITPAGRFEVGFGADLGPHDVLWVDYDAAISLHRVVTSNAAEHRLQRLATPSTADNRISFGCINVPVRFYEGVIQPLFRPANGIAYILPETPAFGSLIAHIEANPHPR